jgi:hypothetical protein
LNEVSLPDGRVWLRVAKAGWRDPLDPAFARERGGRWNPPGSFPVLYLNGDVATARMQIERMLADSPVRMDDLDDAAFVMVAVTLPRAQSCADAVTPPGLTSLGLPATYPCEASGRPVARAICRMVGSDVHAERLRGVWCRSACTNDGRGRELAWFPATARSRAKPKWRRPLPLGKWRHAGGWSDIGIDDQRDP